MLLLSTSVTRAKRLASDLMDEGLGAFYSEDTGREQHGRDYHVSWSCAEGL